MANFVKQKMARESIEDENITGLSNIEPEQENLDAQLAELPNDEAGLDQLENDGETLADDFERTEALVEKAVDREAAGEEMSEEAIQQAEVATESIARRWCLNSRKLARESFRRGRGMTKAAAEGWKETLKDLYKRFIEWCKEVINRIKDLKLKYLNAGKSAVKRAEKYELAIRKLGAKDKDEISGAFVTKLSIDGKYNVSASIEAAKQASAGKVKSAISALEAQAKSVEVYMTKAADGSDATFDNGASGKVELFGTASTKLSNLPQFEDATDKQRVMALPGNAYLQSGTKKLAGDADFTAIAFTTTGDATEDKNVPTPSASELSQSAGGLKAIGKGYEGMLKDFRSYDSEIEKLQRAAEKASNAFDKATEDGDRQKLSAARSAADQAVRNYQTLHRAATYTINTVIAGLNGYLSAGINAYKKSK